MPALTVTDLIWNRACFGGHRQRVGDVGLAALLEFHGLAMNGGVLHAIECLGSDRLTQVCEGFRYFGFDAVAADLEEAATALDEHDSFEEEMDQRYALHVSGDQVLVNAFEADYACRPDNYAAVE